MTKPAKPEQNNEKIGTSNPAQSLWDDKKVIIGPPEAGQPRKGSAAPESGKLPAIIGPKR